MKVAYFLNGIYLWEVEEDSLMHRVLQDIQRRQYERDNARARALIEKGLPVSIKQKEHKDILYDLRKES
jgi:hypothetical protein